ncbi:3',5'-cyclic-AMP phosphodiesterase [Vibrio sp. SCSIO 43137]|uniref:3',5'-cyclic-AMP phosphodiesterase n=1 Tax=Vibrio sp. SCSIO 43137 TaxID=3021011 RepID=UPI0023074FD4|nr:3',5'-cyclic-AMP phosphodiesterase [Vibrio sp. SCSIO 43137]WCE29291.1 3',5'-cyclic-AMP phosphodiesterase [Vibrio sp. SCSIO 43137]
MKFSAASDNSSIQLLQITDTHLFSDTDGCLLSVNTLESFHAVVDEIIQSDICFDAILATGDISQDHTAESYQRFEQVIAPLTKPCFWLPGNHDFKPSMQSILPSAQVQADTHVLAGEHWQIILLDSQVKGVPHGKLSEQQLAFLDEKLSENPSLHSLVLLHHHPVLVGSAWLDQHTLSEAENLWAVVAKHQNVKGLLCGHVHQDYDQVHHGVRVITTPSTCVQFKPDSQDFALDGLSPGWRTLELFNDGSIKTKVYRLPNGRFLPDFASSGY